MSLTSRSLPPWPDHARRVLLLGGARSGKSQLAESLLAGSPTVRYVATAAPAPADTAWQERIRAHRARRPGHWTTEEIDTGPERLAELLTAANPEETVLIDDLGCWLSAVLESSGRWDDPQVADEPSTALATAVAQCEAARLVIVSPEAGMGVVPATEAGRTFADAQGALNRRVAEACDTVALVVAGLPLWLSHPSLVSGAGSAAAGTASMPTRGSTTSVGLPAAGAPTGPDGPRPTIEAPDYLVGTQSLERLQGLDVPGSGLGTLVEIVRFAATVQGRPDPRPWQQVRVLALHGDHAGGIGAGDSPEASARRVAEVLQGEGALAQLATAAGAAVTTVECPPSAAIEGGDAIAMSVVDEALAEGRRLADAAVDSGADLIVLASCGTGGPGVAAAVAATIGCTEFTPLLPRRVRSDGSVDDHAWMQWCLAVRDALHRIRHRARDPRTLLATLGGGDTAVATGVLLGAAERRTPVLIDGPVGAAAALIARESAIASARWVLLPDHGQQPALRYAATMAGLETLFDLRLGLGEGATALAVLPLLRSSLAVAGLIRPETASSEPPVDAGAMVTKSSGGAAPQPETDGG